MSITSSTGSSSGCSSVTEVFSSLDGGRSPLIERTSAILGSYQLRRRSSEESDTMVNGGGGTVIPTIKVNGNTVMNGSTTNHQKRSGCHVMATHVATNGHNGHSNGGAVNGHNGTNGYVKSPHINRKISNGSPSPTGAYHKKSSSGSNLPRKFSHSYMRYQRRYSKHG